VVPSDLRARQTGTPSTHRKLPWRPLRPRAWPRGPAKGTAPRPNPTGPGAVRPGDRDPGSTRRCLAPRAGTWSTTAATAMSAPGIGTRRPGTSGSDGPGELARHLDVHRRWNPPRLDDRERSYRPHRRRSPGADISGCNDERFGDRTLRRRCNATSATRDLARFQRGEEFGQVRLGEDHRAVAMNPTRSLVEHATSTPAWRGGRQRLDTSHWWSCVVALWTGQAAGPAARIPAERSIL